MRKWVTVTATVLLTAMLTACGGSAEYERTLKLEKDGEYEAALSSIGQALEKNPEKAEYYLEEGIILTLLERYEEARESFSRAIVEKDLEITRKNNKKAYRGIGITYYREKNYEKAVEYFTKALDEELLPEWSTDIRHYLADAYLALEQYAEALPICEALVKEEPEELLCQSQYAKVLHELGKYEESITVYDKVISLNNADFSGYIGKYQALAALGRTDEMAAVLQQMERLENPNAEQAYFIAKGFFAAGEYDKAIGKLTSSLENGYEDAHYYMAEIYKMQGNYSEAVYQFNEYIKNAGEKDSIAYNQLAVCLLEQKQYEQALEAVRTGLDIRSSECRQQLLQNEIVILEQSGQYTEAYAKAKAYMQEYPEDEAMAKEVVFLETRVRE